MDEKKARQACDACGLKAERSDFEPPCDECQHAPPDLMPENELADIIYGLCYGAREGLSGALDCGALIEIMRRLNLSGDEWFDVWQKIMYAESVLRMREDKSKTMEAKGGR